MKETNVCVCSTTDYSEIKHVNGNRLTNPRNIEKIKNSMMIKHLVVPAILNENMEIIDGQHRLAACKELGFPFYYIVVDGYHLPEVQMINANMKNWVNQDFLNSFIDLYKLGDSSYINYVELSNFMEETSLPLRTALTLSDLRLAPAKVEERFKDGNFRFYSMQDAVKIAEALKDFEQYNGSKWNQSGFAKVFAQFFLNEKYNHETMIKNLPFTFNKLNLMGNEASTRANLIEMYNHRTPKAKKLYTDSLIDSWEDMLKS